MCGRFVRHTNVHELTKFFGTAAPSWDTPPNYNVAPTQQVPAVRVGADRERELVLLRWDASGDAPIVKAQTKVTARPMSRVLLVKLGNVYCSYRPCGFGKMTIIPVAARPVRRGLAKRAVASFTDVAHSSGSPPLFDTSSVEVYARSPQD